jgi:hypothetical protein
MTCEATCPFTGYGAHSVLMEDGSTGSFCLLIPQTQHTALYTSQTSIRRVPHLLKNEQASTETETSWR